MHRPNIQIRMTNRPLVRMLILSLLESICEHRCSGSGALALGLVMHFQHCCCFCCCFSTSFPSQICLFFFFFCFLLMCFARQYSFSIHATAAICLTRCIGWQNLHVLFVRHMQWLPNYISFACVFVANRVTKQIHIILCKYNHRLNEFCFEVRFKVICILIGHTFPISMVRNCVQNIPLEEKEIMDTMIFCYDIGKL